MVIAMVHCLDLYKEKIFNLFYSNCKTYMTSQSKVIIDRAFEKGKLRTKWECLRGLICIFMQQFLSKIGHS